MIVGVGNADPESLESFQRPQHKAWHGRCVVILKTTQKPGDINLTVTADGIGGKTVSLHANKI